MATTRSTRVKKVKHSLFMNCAEIEPTAFWKTILQSCAYGSFPKGMTYKNNTIYYRKTKRKPGITVEVSDIPEQALETIKNTFRNDIGVVSSDEYSKKQAILFTKLKDLCLDEKAKWKDIRAPTVRHQMICAFAYNKGQEEEKTRYEIEQLMACIIMGILIEQLTSDDIIISPTEGKIIDIEHLEYDPEKGYYIDKPFKPMRIVPEKVGQAKQISTTDAYQSFVKKHKQNARKSML